MCMKCVVNHERRRGGKEQRAPVGLQYLSLPMLSKGDHSVCGVNNWRKVINTHLE